MKKRKDGRRQGGKIQAGGRVVKKKRKKKEKKKVQVLWTYTMILWTQRSLELVSKFLIHFQTKPVQ